MSALDAIDGPLKVMVRSSLTAEAILNEKATDEAIGKLVRRHFRAALEELKKLTPNPVLLTLDSALTAYDADEWEDYATAQGWRE